MWTLKRHERHQPHTVDGQTWILSEPSHWGTSPAQFQQTSRKTLLIKRAFFAAGIERAIEESTFYNLEFLCWRIYIWSSESTTSSLIFVHYEPQVIVAAPQKQALHQPPRALQHRHKWMPRAVRATWPYLTDRRKQRRHWRERAYLKCFSRNHARSLNNWERSTIIFASSWWLLRQKAPRVRVVAHASTRLPTHTRAAVIAWMIHVLSRLQLYEKTAWWCYPQMGGGGGRGGGEGKKKSHRRFERASLPLGENESYFVLQKTAWPLMRKARTNTMLRTLIPQSCQQPRKIAEHDEWWKKGNRAVTDKEASIIHISCVHECARVHDTATVF